VVARLLLRAELRQGARAHLAVVAMLAGVAAALTLAAVVGRMASAPWERTWRATGGAHLTLIGMDRDALAQARSTVPGITASSGPVETGFTGLHAGSWHVETRLVELVARGPGRPALVQGDRSGVVFERSFARHLGVRPGDTVTLGNGRRERVSGLAVVSDQEPFPFGQPGLTFGSRALLDAVVPAGRGRFAFESVRLADPASAPLVEARLQQPGARASGASSWQSQRADVGERFESVRIALELLSALLMLCAAPIVATLVSERILARAREFAILRAGGLTPGGIVGLTGAVYAVLGLAGGVIGLGIGVLAAPLVTAESEELLSAPGIVGPAPAAAVAVVAGTAVLAALAAAVPAWLLSRRPATEALASAAGGGRRRPSRLARAARAARLPVAAVLGVGDAFARRPRALLAMLALALSIAALVGAVAMEMNFSDDQSAAPVDRRPATADSGGEPFDVVTPADSEVERLRGVVYPGVAALLGLGLANLVAVLALALREGRRDTGVLRAVGLTPRDAALMVVWRQLTLSVGAAALGVPLGLGLWWLGTERGDAPDVSYPSAPALAAAAVVAIAATTLVTAPLARVAARLPVTAVLRQD
jgi:ABC-type lipoprotein release transport system permease subunit